MDKIDILDIPNRVNTLEAEVYMLRREIAALKEALARTDATAKDAQMWAGLSRPIA